MTDAPATELPRWDVSDLHESFAARSFLDALDGLHAGTARLVGLFDELDIRAGSGGPATAADGEAADRAIAAFNDVEADLDLQAAFVDATLTTDSRDERAQALSSELSTLAAVLVPLRSRLAAWVADVGVDSLAAVSTEAAAHHGPLTRLAERAGHQMSEAEEHLYAELRLTGSLAWSRLHSDVTSQLRATVTMPGGTAESMPIAAVRGLATSPDPAVRQAAYEAEQAAWPTVAVVCAAALNGVKGEAATVNRRRAWDTPLAASCFANSVTPATLDAMQDAVTRSLPDLRRWMRAKADRHGDAGGLRWWNLVAPLPGGSTEPVSWSDGVAAVRRAFATFSPGLAGLVERATTGRWIDVAPRDGKEGGAFCMPFVGDRSLILLNWDGSLDGVQTLAHELGHAYHNTQLAGRTALQRALPMTLAETASIFCETLMTESALASLDDRARLALLDVDLAGVNQVIVDIRSRFLFESAVMERRTRTTLGVTELNELMTAAQADAYGDGLDQATAHPYMWAVKSHYYSSAFYNWPYTFGLLFGIGLYASYQRDPERFRQGYDDALSRAGMDRAEDLAQRFGFDLTTTEFWDASLDVVRARIAAYCELAAR